MSKESSAADKVIGKASAKIYNYLEVFGELISKIAISELKKSKIIYRH